MGQWKVRWEHKHRQRQLQPAAIFPPATLFASHLCFIFLSILFISCQSISQFFPSCFLLFCFRISVHFVVYHRENKIHRSSEYRPTNSSLSMRIHTQSTHMKYHIVKTWTMFRLAAGKSYRYVMYVELLLGDKSQFWIGTGSKSKRAADLLVLNV